MRFCYVAYFTNNSDGMWSRERPNYRLKQPSVIAFGDASSLDAKTQFVASYAPRETVGRANVALRLREHIKLSDNFKVCQIANLFISPLKGEVDASFASRRKGCARLPLAVLYEKKT